VVFAGCSTPSLVHHKPDKLLGAFRHAAALVSPALSAGAVH
jgi:hypothetical protein